MSQERLKAIVSLEKACNVQKNAKQRAHRSMMSSLFMFMVEKKLLFEDRFQILPLKERKHLQYIFFIIAAE